MYCPILLYLGTNSSEISGNILAYGILIKPRHMHEGYGSRYVCLCVCMCVCYLASGYIPGLYVQSEAAYTFLFSLFSCGIYHRWTTLDSILSDYMIVQA